ncbi:Nucleotide-binding universal stress protein, UspA family [Halobiforma haloterrestris]|uniref:Nucleotide-binding universal stress protein, UspA family n=1 Tax=Natronobacterium haloterrestre TaxID=148448 RepID=A0A1I1K2G5_NATHA|nr:universal stress protein [Halobiforma haloterrestris]SFC55129.1 Nucleotide-binding universal stress protein, UspA family [Halobiforma haloterrestris]
MTDHVLVPVDESERSTQALEFACTEYPDADITAIHVLDPGDFYAATGIEGGAMANYDEIRKHHETQADNILEQARREAEEYGREIETDQVVGGVSQSIVDYAGAHDVDHIVVGSHGRTGASRILLGSVAETVARRSPVPVTIVR